MTTDNPYQETACVCQTENAPPKEAKKTEESEKPKTEEAVVTPALDTEASGAAPNSNSKSETAKTPTDAASLSAEVTRLREALAAKEEEQARLLGELAEFDRLFPEVSVRSVPQDVWQSVREGLPLSAAYALYEAKQHREAARAEAVNRRNASRASGQAGQNTKGDYFSPEEVRAMSQKQVHEHYAVIQESMKSWK